MTWIGLARLGEKVEGDFPSQEDVDCLIRKGHHEPYARERAVSQNLVRLYKALGRGWEEDSARKHALR